MYHRLVVRALLRWVRVIVSNPQSSSIVYTQTKMMELTTKQQNLLSQVTKLISTKYEELLWNECYYDGDSQEIKDILGQLQSENVEVNFDVTLTPYYAEV